MGTSQLATADEMDYLNSIALGQNRRRPLIAPDHLLIKLNRNSRRCQ